MVKVFPKAHYVCKNNRPLKPLVLQLHYRESIMEFSHFVPKDLSSMKNNLAPIKRRVLIVDDEPAVRQTVRGVLESSGFECAESENGAGALAWLEENHTDVIIADYEMPIMSGLKLLERVKRTLNGKTPRVIMLSGVIQDHEKHKAIDLGAFAIIDKPCNFRELVVKVNEAIDP